MWLHCSKLALVFYVSCTTSLGYGVGSTLHFRVLGLEPDVIVGLEQECVSLLVLVVA